MTVNFVSDSSNTSKLTCSSTSLKQYMHENSLKYYIFLFIKQHLAFHWSIYVRRLQFRLWYSLWNSFDERNGTALLLQNIVIRKWQQFSSSHTVIRNNCLRCYGTFNGYSLEKHIQLNITCWCFKNTNLWEWYLTKKNVHDVKTYM